ncbi:MAG: peptide deformylase [Rickettsiales bacterium]|nr:peptide deformylase [Rickettsiales bacterium]
MSVLKIVKWPDPLLKEVSQTVEKIDKELQKFMLDMHETMLHENGIGLAAVQVGQLKRILVIQIQDNERYDDVESDENSNYDALEPLFIINPEIIKKSDDITIYKEGCLSFPGQYANVKRHSEITVEYKDFHGNKQKLEASGILSICLQHEIDHLNGIRFIDHLSALKRRMLLKKLEKNKN